MISRCPLIDLDLFEQISVIIIVVIVVVIVTRAIVIPTSALRVWLFEAEGRWLATTIFLAGIGPPLILTIAMGLLVGSTAKDLLFLLLATSFLLLLVLLLMPGLTSSRLILVWSTLAIEPRMLTSTKLLLLLAPSRVLRMLRWGVQLLVRWRSTSSILLLLLLAVLLALPEASDLVNALIA